MYITGFLWGTPSQETCLSTGVFFSKRIERRCNNLLHGDVFLLVFLLWLSGISNCVILSYLECFLSDLRHGGPNGEPQTELKMWLLAVLPVLPHCLWRWFCRKQSRSWFLQTYWRAEASTWAPVLGLYLGSYCSNSWFTQLFWVAW